MKKNILAFLLILFSVSAFAQHTQKDLLGRWEGADAANTPAAITFLDSNKVIVAINGAALPPYKYAIDLTKNPAAIDIKMFKLDGSEAILPGFLLFVDDNTIKWQIFPGGTRAAAYDEKSNAPIITLKRKKD